MKKKGIVRQLLFYVVVIGIVILMGSLLYTGQGGEDQVTYDDVLNYFYNEQVTEVEITPKNLLKLKVTLDGEEKTVSYKLRTYEQFYRDLGELIAE